jgi:hypothetical protein
MRMILSVLSLFVASTAWADISCRNSNGYDLYLYPGANPNGTRVPVGEFSGPRGESDFMTCNQSYTSCQGKTYRFSWSDEPRVMGPGLLEILICRR